MRLSCPANVVSREFSFHLVADAVVRNMFSGLPVGADDGPVNTSTLDQASQLAVQQGYDSMMMDAMIHHYHGS